VTVYVVRGRVEFTNAAGQTVVVGNNQVVTVDDQGNISVPVEASEAQKAALRSAVGDTQGDRVIDVTIISPSGSE
jgi:hypothetical protein